MLDLFKNDPLFQELKNFKPIDFIGIVATVVFMWVFIVALTVLLG